MWEEERLQSVVCSLVNAQLDAFISKAKRQMPPLIRV